MASNPPVTSQDRPASLTGQGSMDSTESSTPDQVLRDEGNFIQNVSQFFNTEALSDVNLRVGDVCYYGHKFVLATSSDVFRTMLYERHWVQSSQNEIELNESQECQAVFEKFLRYLYTAEIHIGCATAVGLLCLADKYNVRSLKQLCSTYMIENSRSPNVKNALNWLSWAKALSLEELKAQCIQTIAWNADDIVSSADWSTMDEDYVCDMLKSSELVIANEFTLFQALERWLLHRSHVEKLGDLGQKMLPLVRFPLMMVSQLYQLEHSQIASKDATKSIIHSLINQAYRFRALCPTQGQLDVSFNSEFYMPRDYKSLTVDNVRMQNTLRFGLQVDVRMYRGPVPNEARDGDWKITYRKQGDVWTVQIYCHETAMVNNEAHFEASVLICNEQEKVVQVQRAPRFVCTRGNSMNLQVSIKEPENATTMAVLIKPVPL